MQQVGPRPDDWWRADTPRTPRPVLQGPADASLRRHRLGLWVLGAAAFLLLGNPELRAAALGQIERGVELAGFGLQEITLSGHRYSADVDIYAALDLDNTRTLLSFDAAAAKNRLEKLPWIETASIERVAPYGIDVHVTERAPFAVWHTEGRGWLVDRSGHKLQPAPADIMPQLPRVAGDGAAREVAGLTALLAAFPAIAHKVEVAERVGGRRWTLRLAEGPKGGLSVELPATGEAEALTRLDRLLKIGLGSARRIDLRASTRTLVDGLDPTSTAASRSAALPAGRT